MQEELKSFLVVVVGENAEYTEHSNLLKLNLSSPPYSTFPFKESFNLDDEFPEMMRT